MNNLLKTYNFSNFEMFKGNGVNLFNSKNRSLLDFQSGVAVNSLEKTILLLKKHCKNN